MNQVSGWGLRGARAYIGPPRGALLLLCQQPPTTSLVCATTTSTTAWWRRRTGEAAAGEGRIGPAPTDGRTDGRTGEVS